MAMRMISSDQKRSMCLKYASMRELTDKHPYAQGAENCHGPINMSARIKSNDPGSVMSTRHAGRRAKLRLP
jgi:hypothetical protein